MITLFLIIILGLPLASALLTYTLYCYEQANQQGVSLGQLLPDVLRTAVKSYLYECMMLVLHPLGLWPDLWSKPKAGQPIVILVHGLFHNQSGWIFYRHWLEAQGYSVACYRYPSWRTDLESVESSLKEYLEQIMTNHPDQPIHLVGHSLGGLLLRATLTHLTNVRPIKTLVTLGTPYQGSKLAPFALNSLGRFLTFQGETIQEINSRTVPSHIQYLALRVPVDNMVLPNSALYCHLPQCTEQITSHCSHIAMLYSKNIFLTILHWIRATS